MYGIMFDDIHSFNDLGLILTSLEVGIPKPKTMLVDINGANGSLDLTEALTGYVQYKNRTMRFEFSVFAGKKEWVKAYNRLLTAIHGKKMKIVLDEDKNYFYIGRVSVNSWRSRKTLNSIVVEVDAEPYKYMMQSSEDAWMWDFFNFETGIIYQTSYEVSGSLTVRVPNEQMVLCPEFECSEAMQLTFRGKTYDLPAGRSQNFEVMLEEGINVMEFTGSGTVKIIYRGGTL